MTGQPRSVRIPMTTVIKGFTAANIQMLARRPADSAGIQKKPTFLTHMHLDQRRTVRIAMATVIKGSTAPDIKMLARRPVDSAEVPKSLIFPTHWHPGLSAWMTFPTVLIGMWTVKYMEMHARRPVDSVTMTMTIRMTMMTMTLAVLIITLTVPRLLQITGVQYIKANAVRAVRKLRKKKNQAAWMKPVDVATIKHSCASNTQKNARKLVDSAMVVLVQKPRGHGLMGFLVQQPVSLKNKLHLMIMSHKKNV